MRFCGFCGKGPFPSSSTLNKHIRHSVNCNKAERQEWGIYATNIWDNAPGHSDNPHQPLEPPQILDNEELASLPDTTLEDDLQGQADLSETALDPDIPDIPDIPRHEPENNTSTVNDHEDEAARRVSALNVECGPKSEETWSSRCLGTKSERR